MPGAQRRKFSEEEKRLILNEANSKGVNVVLREQNLSYSVFARWKAKYQSPDVGQHPQGKILQQLKDLTKENDRLKRIIANMALELQVKSEKQKK